jgi:hypothetical protein
VTVRNANNKYRSTWQPRRSNMLRPDGSGEMAPKYEAKSSRGAQRRLENASSTEFSSPKPAGYPVSTVTSCGPIRPDAIPHPNPAIDIRRHRLGRPRNHHAMRIRRSFNPLKRPASIEHPSTGLPATPAPPASLAAQLSRGGPSSQSTALTPPPIAARAEA